MLIIPLVTLALGTVVQPEYAAPFVPVEVNDELGQQLIDTGKAKRPDDSDFIEGEYSTDNDDSIDALSLIDDLIDAIADLSPDGFGADGKPKVKPLEAIVGRPVSAESRDQAFSLYKNLTEEKER